MLAVDLGTGEPLAIGHINELESKAVQRWVGKTLTEYKKLFLKNGYGSWRRSSKSLKSFHPMGVRGYMPSGDAYPVVAPNAIKPVLAWNIYVTCSCV